MRAQGKTQTNWAWAGASHAFESSGRAEGRTLVVLSCWDLCAWVPGETKFVSRK